MPSDEELGGGLALTDQLPQRRQRGLGGGRVGAVGAMGGSCTATQAEAGVGL